MIEGIVELVQPDCFRCMAMTPANIERRRVCVEAGEHRPLGELVVHDGRILRVCSDCGTLVVPVLTEV